MITKDQIAQEFKEKLYNLLKEYSGDTLEAYLEAEDHYQGYPECGEDIRMTVSIPALYDKEGNQIREWIEIDLGRYFKYEKGLNV